MLSHRVRALVVGAIGSLALSGCAGIYGGAGYGGFGYNNYGYEGFGSPYGSGNYRSSYGWYNGYYYPGTGYYVYDSNRRSYRWNDSQRRYWEGRRDPRVDQRRVRANWRDFRNQRVQERRQDRRDDRRDRRRDRRD